MFRELAGRPVAIPDRRAVLAIPGAHLHLYGKAERPGRKVGHITVRAQDPGVLEARVASVLACLTATP